jgi:methionyl-tRNA formyltransferase
MTHRLASARTVVFGYHSVGVRALSVLLQLGFDVILVVTHQDAQNEQCWFENLREHAQWSGIPWLTPENPNQPEIVTQIRDLAPDWIFSFYYRCLLAEPLLTIPTYGAYNLHGSLLPAYRGRAPLNWAIVHGEQQTGMTLHRMVAQPDAGPIVDQEAIPIFTNDTAKQVFDRLLCAGERLLLRALPQLLAHQAQESAQNLEQGHYYGARCPDDGRIDWQASAWQIHNLIRAVAPPYPGAFYDRPGDGRWYFLGSWYRAETARHDYPCLYWEDGACYCDCSDHQRIRIVRLIYKETLMTAQRWHQQFDIKAMRLSSIVDTY